ncbi:hypothetical protein [Turneriella parva]|uniref:DUF3365 domain-containing protein n=1 Tax=Turneriella parva (strain ATCC BAA-1111 / DSM 21527 / NCTC 11395 / H) TaxID=869212 RepID=I4B642_TURPD|nr:hypothetical protein [Turneriella parva]AFM12749.1 hypothetical protein Turpa_2103 [Turneriella parva DSM 21527]
MKISTRLWIAVTAVLTLASLFIKFYFLPAAERFTRLSVEEQIHRDMVAFEKIIGVVVTAANGDQDYVRRALYAISADKTIPIELRRSDFLNSQFGVRKDRVPQNDFERRVLQSAQAAFRQTDQFIEYAYPLKAQPICQTCHVGADNKAIALGQPVGLAIRRLPLSALSESRISYFTLDLFWENFGLLVVCMLGLLVPVWWWVLRPLSRFSAESEGIIHRRDMADDSDKTVLLPESEKMPEEWRSIRRIIDDARDR